MNANGQATGNEVRIENEERWLKMVVRMIKEDKTLLTVEDPAWVSRMGTLITETEKAFTSLAEDEDNLTRFDPREVYKGVLSLKLTSTEKNKLATNTLFDLERYKQVISAINKIQKGRKDLEKAQAALGVVAQEIGG